MSCKRVCLCARQQYYCFCLFDGRTTRSSFISLFLSGMQYKSPFWIRERSPPDTHHLPSILCTLEFNNASAGHPGVVYIQRMPRSNPLKFKWQSELQFKITMKSTLTIYIIFKWNIPVFIIIYFPFTSLFKVPLYYLSCSV